jgi:hypothetical protein
VHKCDRSGLLNSGHWTWSDWNMETGEKRGRVEVLRNGLAGEMSAAPPVFHHSPSSVKGPRP